MDKDQMTSTDKDLSHEVLRNAVSSVYRVAIDGSMRGEAPRADELRELAVARLAYGRAVMERMGARWNGSRALREMAYMVVTVATEPREQSMLRSTADLDAFMSAMDALRQAAGG